MTAQVLTGHGGYEALSLVDDHPTPSPGPGEVVVRVGACGLNNTDINTRTAWYSRSVKDGITDDGGKHGFSDAKTNEGSWSNPGKEEDDGRITQASLG